MPNNYPNRHSNRLRGYDYSSDGLYFITICTHQREPLFGEIVSEQMILNDAGIIVHNSWLNTANIRPNIMLDEFIVMPNHFHAVFAIGDSPCRGVLHTPVLHTPVLSPGELSMGVLPTGVCDTPLRSPSGTVGAIIRGFKSAVTKQLGYSRVWQRNYHDHIIRTQSEYEKITQYVVDNPARWQEDRFNV